MKTNAAQKTRGTEIFDIVLLNDKAIGLVVRQNYTDYIQTVLVDLCDPADKNDLIGRLIAYHIDITEVARDHESLLIVMDEHSQQLSNVFAACFLAEKGTYLVYVDQIARLNLPRNPNILYIDSLYLKERYRGLGYGKVVLLPAVWAIIRRLHAYGKIGIVVVEPGPMNPDYDHARDYEGHGIRSAPHISYHLPPFTQEEVPAIMAKLRAPCAEIGFTEITDYGDGYLGEGGYMFLPIAL
jgi:hypothetical protein